MSTIAGTSTSSTGPTPGCTSWSSRSDEKGPVRFPFRSRHACTSADLPFQADPPDRPVRAGRQLGVRRAHRVRRDGQGARPEFRGREQAGRRRKYRNGRSRARRARRLHADHRAHRHARREPVHGAGAALRCKPRLRADLAARQGGDPVRGARRRAGEGSEGADRARPARAGQAQLRLGGKRERRPPCHGIPEARHRRHRSPARAVQGHRTHGDRPGGRPHAGRRRRHAAALAARQGRQAACGRGRHAGPPPGAARRALGGRAGLPGIRDLAVVRADRAGKDARFSNQKALRRSREGGSLQGRARAPRHGERDPGRLDAAGVRAIHRKRAGPLERSHSKGPHQGGLMYDVIVVGGGNAAFCAALAAREHCDRVLVLERAPEEEAGGNSRFTAGLLRVAYRGVDDLKRLIPDLSEEEIASTDFGAYTEEQFLDDMARVTEYRCDPDLTEVLVRQSLPTALWMRSKGVRFTAAWNRQAFKVEGRFKFWGGLTVEAVGGGPGLVDSLTQAARKHGIDIWYESRAVSLISDDDGVHGVILKKAGKTIEVKSRSIVLAAGGFQANTEWRTRYLGPGWELAKVRGTRFNTGDAIRMALAIGAAAHGDWSGCHAVAWDRNAPETGDLAVGDGFQKHSYPWGVYINADGKRFVDEGADFRNYTYAKYGRVILSQPKQFAWQIFDAKVKQQLRDEYRIKQVTRISGNTLEELVSKMDDTDQQAALETLKKYNAAVRQDIAFNPNVKDGRRTEGLEVNKTNWANTLDTAPFEAYAVTCGITFSFGGLRITTDARVLSSDGEPIGGLYAAGELVGGIFWFNYPGGSGLTNGAVFGKIAGASAAKQAG